MKTIATLSLLFPFLAFAATSALKLESLKPTQKSKVQLGELDVALIAANDGKTIAKLSGTLGDCKGCIRGASIRGDLGIRIEGVTADALNVVKKHNDKVKLTSCDQEKLEDSKTVCEFEYNERSFKLVFTPRNRKAVA